MGVHAARKERSERGALFEKQVFGPSILYSSRNRLGFSDRRRNRGREHGRICQRFVAGSNSLTPVAFIYLSCRL
jgi:hypothetical protein